MKLRFVKMEGAGNDYVYVDGFAQRVPNPSRVSRIVSDRHVGIGADGLILILPSRTADVRMQMFNADGSEGAMCGNGIRCLAKYAYEHKLVRKRRFVVETKAGPRPIEVHVRNGVVHSATVDMGVPAHGPAQKIRVAGKTFSYVPVSMGNPHAVIFVPKITNAMVLGAGPAIERHRRFPGRTNVEFVTVKSRASAVMRVWERGSGETLACGTGACAAAVAGMLRGTLQRRARMKVLGGVLEISWSEKNGHVYLRGPAREVFSGTIVL